MNWDLSVLETLADHRTTWADGVATGLMDVGQPKATYVVAFVLALAFAGVFRAWRAVGAALLASAAATALAELGKEAIGRPRPPAELALVPTDGFAMPSSIAALTAGAAVPLVLWGMRRADVLGRLVAAALLLGTVLIGVSMVYLGAHWLSDVLAGWALGTVLAAVAFQVLSRGRRQPATAGR